VEQINSQHPAARSDLPRRNLRPAAGGRAKIDDDRSRAEQLLALVELEQLVRRARTITLLPRLAHIRVGDVAAQPLLARFRHRAASIARRRVRDCRTLGLDQPMANGEAHEARNVADLELGHQPPAIGIDRTGLYAERARDLL